jgi:hypothetical protein
MIPGSASFCAAFQHWCEATRRLHTKRGLPRAGAAAGGEGRVRAGGGRGQDLLPNAPGSQGEDGRCGAGQQRQRGRPAAAGAVMELWAHASLRCIGLMWRAGSALQRCMLRVHGRVGAPCMGLPACREGQGVQCSAWQGMAGSAQVMVSKCIKLRQAAASSSCLPLGVQRKKKDKKRDSTASPRPRALAWDYTHKGTSTVC